MSLIRRVKHCTTVLLNTSQAFGSSNMLMYAAALAYRTTFALFPFLIFLISLLGFLHLGYWFDWLREQAVLFIPKEALAPVNIVIDQLQEQQKGFLSLGIVLALITASGGVRSLMIAMNEVHGVKETRPMWRIYSLALIYTLGLAGLVLLSAGLMILGPQVMEWISRWVGLDQLFVMVWSIVRWPLIVVLLMMFVAIIYYVTPNVHGRFRLITVGSVLSIVIWIAASLGFGFYLQSFANYNATYGSIGAMIVLLLFFYLSWAVLLFGAVLNVELDKMKPNYPPSTITKE